MSDTTQPLSFDLSLAEIPVTLTNSGGVEEEFVIRELTGKQRDGYLNGMSKRTKSLPGGDVKVTNFDGLQGSLLSRCMYRVGDDDPVDLKEIQGWPAKVQSDLFDAARELSGLNKEEDEDEEGND